MPQRVYRWRVTDIPFQLRLFRNWIIAKITGTDVVLPMRKNWLRPGYSDFFEGFGGVLVRPDFFDDACFDIPPVMWNVDDVWLSGMLARRGHFVWLDHRAKEPRERDIDLSDSLYFSQIDGHGRHESNRLCAEFLREKYGIWP